MRSSALFVIVIICALGFTTPRSAMAQASATWQGEIDGVPMWITVVPRGHEISDQMREQEPWWRWGNATTDAYLFAVQSPDSVRLILDFNQQADGLPEARIYLNQMGGESIDYSLEGETLRVRSNDGHPYATLRPADGGWLIGDKVNYNLSLSIDGSLRDMGFPQSQTDGQVDVSIRVGSTQPGRPDWQTLRLVHDPHPTWGYPRFVVRQRMPNAPPFKADSPLIPSFPYFGMGAAGIEWFDKNPNPLYFNLIDSVFDLFPFPGFHTGGMYEVNSLTLPPNVDFETPFAFYNFDPTTRFAQLVVRAQSMPAGDQFGPEPTSAQRSTFRYSWKTLDNTRWAYSLHVAGPYTYTEQVEIGNDTFWGVPGAELPSWVASKEWPIMTFVEAVDGYPGTEGIYFYSAQSNTSWPWLSGMSDHPPSLLAEPFLPQTDAFTDISAESLPPGFRGEYNGAYFRPPKLYLSPIDNRVHLLYAQGGVWNLGKGRVLRMHNLNGDAYIDGWTREQVPAQPEQENLPANGSQVPQASPGDVEEALYALDGFLIYSGSQEAEIRQGAISPSSFETPPPQDKDSWQSFKQKIQPYSGQARDPKNLKQWLSALAGGDLSISQGRIRDVRVTESGFRFILDLQPGFQIQGADLLGVQGLRPDRYVVTHNGAFRIAPLTPPDLSLAIQLSDDESPGVTVPKLFRVQITNAGLEDAKNMMLVAEARRDGPPVEVARQSVDVLSARPTDVLLTWQPAVTGQWQLNVRLEDSDGNVVAQRSESLTVRAGQESNTQMILSGSTGGNYRLLAFITLIVLAVFAMLAVRIIRSSAHVETKQ